MRFPIFAATVVLLVGVASGAAVTLSNENFNALALDSGKGSFVKFYAPWCGHCKAIAPAWSTLGSDFENSKSVLIGDVDCTVEKELCSTQGVSGYPTLKYFPAGEGATGKSYEGGRDLSDLKKFVEETLQVKCLVGEPSGCDAKETDFIASFKSKSAADVDAQLKRLQGMNNGKMKSELKKWLAQRINILKQLQEAGEKPEL